MIEFIHKIKKELVYEGLIYTTNIDTTIDELEKWAIAADKFKLSARNNKIKATFTNNPSVKEIDNLIQNVNRLGWVITSMLMFGGDLKWCKFDIDKIKDITLVALQIEAKFDIEKNIHEIDVLYHVSATRRAKKILSIGLCPKSGEKISAHPARIYLTSSIKDAKVISELFYKKYPDIKLSLFEINFGGVRKNNPSVRVFTDPNFSGGIYTLSNIPPKFVKWIEEL